MPIERGRRRVSPSNSHAGRERQSRTELFIAVNERVGLSCKAACSHLQSDRLKLRDDMQKRVPREATMTKTAHTPAWTVAAISAARPLVRRSSAASAPVASTAITVG